MVEGSFEVVCPSMFTEFLDEMLIPSIEKNTVLPERVLVIDNSSQKRPWEYKGDILNVKVVKPPQPMGVNESWQHGLELSGDCEFLSILNDDIVLGQYFFEKIRRVFENYLAVSTVCPETVGYLNEMPKPELPESKPMRMLGRRAGWAFTIRKEVFKEVPPIPTDKIGKTYCGDDWIFFWTSRKMKRFWALDVGNVIYHAGGSTIFRVGSTETHRGAKRAFCYLKDEILFGKEGAAKIRERKRRTDFERGTRKMLMRYEGYSKKEAIIEADKRAVKMVEEGKL